MQLWAQGSMPDDAKPETDIETTLRSWGTGSNVTTKLCNQAGEVRNALCNTFALSFSFHLNITQLFADVSVATTVSS